MPFVTTVWVRSSFQGFHRWKDAPEDVKFLRDFHRHVFKVRLGVRVDHDNRDVEFFQLKRKLNLYLIKYEEEYFEFSCEQIAVDILAHFNGCVCEVSEDGENGAIVHYTPTETHQTAVNQRQVNTPTLPQEGALNPALSRVEQLPALLKRTRCFVGTEAEGPNRGKPMLFVPGGAMPHEVEQALGYLEEHEVSIWGCYYGAGNDRRFKRETFFYISGRFLVDRITIEVDSLSALGNGKIVGATVVSHDYKDNGHATYIKTLGVEIVIWEGPGGPYITRLDDPLFAKDEEL